MNKSAAIITPLQKHQKAAVLRGLKNNLILAHGTGSGKTLTSIALADAIGKPTTVLTPASLVENYKKELLKHKRGGPKVDVLSLPTATLRGIKVPEGNTLIIDEAHALRNQGTARREYIMDQVRRAGRVFALTGTPNYNNPSDIASLINVVAKENVLPVDDFTDRYIERVVVKPSWWKKLFFGVKDGYVERLKNEAELRKKAKPYIDIFDAEVEKPERIDEEYKTQMSEDQQQIYDAVEGDIPSSIRWKLRYDIPPSKSEASQLNAFLTGVRQVSNTTKPFDVNGSAGTKLRLAVDKLKSRLKDNKKLRALVYSNYLAGGIDSYAELLDKEGIKYNRFTGSMRAPEKKAVVDDYNSGRVPIILASGAGSEGLDLKETRLIQILEPHFNNSKLDQVIGRGIRYKSHANLPKRDRNVTVQRFYSTPYNRDGLAVDEYLSNRAEEKAELFNEIRDVLRN